MSSLEQPLYSRGREPGHRYRRPLIEQCTNKWRDESPHRYEMSPDRATPGEDFVDCLEDLWDNTTTLVKAPRFRRLLAVAFVAIVITVVLCIKVWPFVDEERILLASVGKSGTSASGGLFGLNLRPHFPGMTQVQTLDPLLLPRLPRGRSPEAGNKTRLIFVGDIHGCRDDLEALLNKTHFNPVTDHLIALGDMVSKGPDSRGVIDLLRGYNASCVRGNHDDRLLLLVEDLQSTSLTSKKNSHFPSDLAAQAAVSRDTSLKELALSLDEAQIEWLASCPVILRIGTMKAFHGETVAVHGGLVLDVPLEQQDPLSVMNMRTMDLRTHVPSEKHEQKGGHAKAWYKLWNKHQQLLPTRQGWSRLKSLGRKKPAEKQMTVIYGHDSKTGLKLRKYTKGLDSGCVVGGKLTALVVNGNGKQKIVQVDCKGGR
ncbi:uncharacterized protein PV06_01659 [Exophiala oligosperma]|uniref:Calcineurin-like phosphoesterase domain-containing protein n=1 Tax=Exophiala oligosperma TaxID=215243 RepID=A0A0D2DTY3_9EURO|nr:uncharacterized protein PV06_01659 [Exophiala oligosperma]KIW45960.1 hypothetical protein PV06_01659 [Exophiala oligosperma]